MSQALNRPAKRGNAQMHLLKLSGRFPSQRRPVLSLCPVHRGVSTGGKEAPVLSPFFSHPPPFFKRMNALSRTPKFKVIPLGNQTVSSFPIFPDWEKLSGLSLTPAKLSYIDPITQLLKLVN